MCSLSKCPQISASLVAADSNRAVREFSEARRAWFEDALCHQADPLLICKVHSERIGDLIGCLYSTVPAHGAPVAVLALGGLGRMEMGLCGDIDLLFLHNGASEELMRTVTDRLLYPFWNASIEAGGATRTLDDCRSVIETDVRALTAMTEARFICGDQAIADDLRGLIRGEFSSAKFRRQYIETKIRERRERLKKFGDSIYLLEPNVKEGEGGLRDYHTVLWINYAANLGDAAHSAISEKTIDAVRFLWMVRHALHLIEGKRVDRLSDAIQARVAMVLGFADEEKVTAAEALMSMYYKHAAAIRMNCERVVERALRAARPKKRAAKFLLSMRVGASFLKTEHGTLNIIKSRFGGGPLETLEFFAKAKKLGLTLDYEAKEFVLEKAAHVDEAMRENPAAANLWRGIFSSPRGLEKLLSEMHECGALLEWFPEMRPMFHLVKHDGFHFYTAGVHSIRAAGEISRMKIPKIIKRPLVLVVATLFHDLGKGRGGGHAIAGAKLAEQIMKRIGMNERDIEDVSFLIRSHLLMSRLAFRRDVQDPSLIERFSETIRSPEILAMLYLLTTADLKAVGPMILSDWKAGLLAELYQRTLISIEAPGAFRDRHGRGLEKKTANIEKYLSADVSGAELASFLSKLPDRYLFSTDDETIAVHVLLSREIERTPVATANRPIRDRSCTEFSVVTKDTPGLFARIAGVLTANGINIIGASVYTNTLGLAIDVFLITDAVGRPLEDADQWKRIREELATVITNSDEIERIVSQRFKRRFLSWTQRRRPTEIVIDNDVSATESVVEVHADDRRGLLYTIASTLYNLGCTIERARIATVVDRVVDVFYVKDAAGAKIVSRESLDRIRGALLEAIEE